MAEKWLLSETEFVDATGAKWCCHFGTMDIMDGAKACDLSVGSFQSIHSINIGSMIGMIWYGCRHMKGVRPNMIDERHAMTHEEFYATRVTPEIIMAAIPATMKALTSAFPSDEDAPEADPTPGATADPGTGATS